jgi:tRNA(fMet)-specific endonuclease VapC
MLDTDAVSYALRGQGRVASRLLERSPSEVCISAITLAELRFGAEVKRSKKLRKLIDTFAEGVPAMPFNAEAAARFGQVGSALARAGTPIGSLDTLIAAHALALGVTLVTNNTQHFKRVTGLKVDNWA